MEHETLKETTVSDGRVEDRVGSVVDMEAYSRRLLLMLVGVANRATDRIPRELSSNTRSLKDGPPRVPY
ncbi:MAG: hypothetical protein WAU83_14815, partial [Pseudonocardiaceae bacterium]